MKAIIDYEFKAKIKNEIDLDTLCPRLSYDDFVKKFNDIIDDGVRQTLAEELAEYNEDMITIERISLNITKVEE